MGLLRQSAIALRVRRYPDMRVPAGRAAQYDADMLDSAVGIDEFQADRTDIVADRESDQTPQPGAIDDLRIVVQKNQYVAARGRGGVVVDSGKIEGTRIADQPRRSRAFRCRQIGQSRGVGRTVIDDDKLSSLRRV